MKYIKQMLLRTSRFDEYFLDHFIFNEHDISPFILADKNAFFVF